MGKIIMTAFFCAFAIPVVAFGLRVVFRLVAQALFSSGRLVENAAGRKEGAWFFKRGIHDLEARLDRSADHASNLWWAAMVLLTILQVFTGGRKGGGYS